MLGSKVQAASGGQVAAQAAEASALEPVGAPLARLLGSFLDGCVRELAAIDPSLERIGAEVRDFVLVGG